MSILLPYPSPAARNKPLIPCRTFLLSLHSMKEIEAHPDLPYYYAMPDRNSNWEDCRWMRAGLSWHLHSIMDPATARLFPLLTRIVDLDMAHVRSVADGSRSNGLPRFTYRYVTINSVKSSANRQLISPLLREHSDWRLQLLSQNPPSHARAVYQRLHVAWLMWHLLEKRYRVYVQCEGSGWG
jgi:hypothetical protein